MSPLSTTGQRGEVWSFNPKNNRWTLEYKGKKSSSVNPETLGRKLETWHREGWGASQDTQAEKVQIETRDVLLMVLGSSGDGIGLDARPVAVRASWDASKGAAVAKKIKKFNRKGTGPERSSGWSNFGGHEGDLVDPFELSDKAYEALKERVRGSFLAHKANQAESTIAQAWLEHQERASATIEWPRGEEASITARRPLDEKKKESNRIFSSNRGAVPAGVAHYPSPREGFKPSGWRASKGVWTKGEVKLAVDVSRGIPVFCVQARSLPGEEAETHQTVFSNSCLETAMRVAEITHKILSEKTPMMSFWKGSSEWEKSRGFLGAGISWPSPVDVFGVLTMEGPMDSVTRRDPMVMVLQKDMGLKNYGVSPSWAWVKENLSHYGSLAEFWRRDLPLPREIVDTVRSELQAAMSSPGIMEDTSSESDRHIRPSHLDDPRPLVDPRPAFWRGFKDRSSLKEESSAAIQSAWGRLDEETEGAAQEEPMKDTLEAEWERLIKGMRARIKSDPEVMRITQRWEMLAQEYVESLKQPPKPRGPKA